MKYILLNSPWKLKFKVALVINRENVFASDHSKNKYGIIV